MTGLTRDRYHRYSWNEGALVPGVTGIISQLSKGEGITQWAKRITAEAAVRDLPMLTEMVAKAGPEAAAQFLRSIPEFQKDEAAKLGSRIHTLAEALARKEAITVEPAEAPFIESYVKWVTLHEPKFLNVEYMVYSEKHRYGGTADAVLEIGGEPTLVDYKTSKGVYDATALQLAGYAFADWAGKPGDPKKYRLPRVTKFAVLHIRPEGAVLVPFQIGPEEFEAFLACRRLLRWATERAPVVKGEVELVKAA